MTTDATTGLPPTRPLSRVDTAPAPAPGFIGEGHTAVEVVRPAALGQSDPFVLLMDDRLDIPRRRQIGGPHPHAGLQTVTLVLEGTLVDRDEGALEPGDLVWMTAGSGIIHNEAVEAEGRSRILQLWIGLGARDRAAPPAFEIVRRAAAPVVNAPGIEARVYSGASGTARALTRNLVPVTLVDVALAPGATFEQDLPAAYGGFFYVIDGAVQVQVDDGGGAGAVTTGQVGWFAPAGETSPSNLVVSAAAGGARLILYAGLPLGEPLVQHGPFVAGSRAEIADAYTRFRQGHFLAMSDVARQQRGPRHQQPATKPERWSA